MLLLALLNSPAHAAEVDLEGYYRARFRMYDTLSLNHDLASAEGTSSVVEHRLWLRPNILVNDHLTVRADVFGLDGVDWGQSPSRYGDPVSGQIDPVEWGDQLTPPVPDAEFDTRDFFRDITLAHAWAEVDTPAGRFSFGRMPLHWGLGIWRNDGLGYNGDEGDTADRLMWDRVFEDVFVEVALDSNSENLVNGNDDTFSASGTVGYRTELITTGVVAQYRLTPSRDFGLFTIDASFAGEIGTLDVGAEAIGQYGKGNLEGGRNDVTVAGFGGVGDALLHTSAVDIGVELGVASGDPTPDDAQIATFTFDRDHEVGLVMFEQPMPVIADALATDGRSYVATLSGRGVSNAAYFKPRAEKILTEGVVAHASWLAARTIAAPAADRSGYGNEFDLGVRYEPDEHTRFDLTGGLFLPGGYYSAYTDDTNDTLTGFNDPVWAVQVIGQARF